MDDQKKDSERELYNGHAAAYKMPIEANKSDRCKSIHPSYKKSDKGGGEAAVQKHLSSELRGMIGSFHKQRHRSPITTRAYKLGKESSIRRHGINPFAITPLPSGFSKFYR